MHFSKSGLYLFVFLISYSLCIPPPSHSSSPRVIPVKDPNNIIVTFGSCNAFFGDEPNDIFSRIAEQHPDLWIWLGDVAYVDLKGLPPRFGFTGEAVITQRFNNVKNNPVYSQLSNSTTVIGVWDDHDYGNNNAGKSFAQKDITQQLWLDFIEEPKDSPRRKRPGIYDSYYLGDKTKIKVILLDVRYFKDDVSPFYVERDMLGDIQWEWLENEFKENTAEYILIGSGTQVLPDDRILPEVWFSSSRDRLIKLIQKYKVGGVILLSGDVHFAEIMKHPCKERVGFELYEFTSSGLTHYVSSHVPYVHKFLERAYPNTWSNVEDKFFERNFGLMRFSFGKEKKVRLEARNYYGVLVLEKDIPYSQLVFDEKVVDNNAACVTDESRYSRFFGHYKQALLNGEVWVYGTLAFLILMIMILVTIIKLPFTLLFWVFNKLFRKKPVVHNKRKTE